MESFKLDSKEDGVVDRLALVEQHSSIDEDWEASHPSRVKSACSAHSLKCLYTNARSVGNKQVELEIHDQTGDYDLVAITEIWWDRPHDWNVVMDGYAPIRKERPGR